MSTHLWISKRDGLEKAVYRIEQAIKRRKTDAPDLEDGQTVEQLEGLLHDAQNLLPRHSQHDVGAAFHVGNQLSQPQRILHQDTLEGLPDSDAAINQNSDDHFAVDDAENPLQLLARASDLSGPPRVTKEAPRIPSTPTTLRLNAPKDQALRDFFGPFRPSLDVGKDIDPIEMGLVTQEETDALFE